MTAQEVLDREGFLPLASCNRYSVGEVIQLSPKALGILVRADVKAVVVGILSKAEFRKLETKYLKHFPAGTVARCQQPYFYKVIAE